MRLDNRSIAWLYKPGESCGSGRDLYNRVSKLKTEDAERAYDYLMAGNFFEPTGKVSKKLIGKLTDALVAIGDLPAAISRSIGCSLLV